jgi:PAS domain S-box-containing protein
MTDNRKRLIFLVLIMVIASFISVFFTSLTLYRTVLLKMAIVAEIDLSEVWGPFVMAVSMALGLTLFLVVLGAILFIRIIGTMVKQLERSEEKYRTILESIEDGYYEVDLAGKILFYNNAWCRISGYSRDEILGTNIRKYLDREAAVDIIETSKEVYSKGISIKSLECRSKKKDGSKIDLEFSISPIKDREGNPIGFRGIIRDVTERKRLETQLILSQRLDAVGRFAGGVAHDFNNLMTIVIGNAELMLMGLAKNDPLRKDVKEIRKAGDRAASLTRQILAFSRKQALSPRVLDLNTVLTEMNKMLKRIIGEDVEIRTIYAQGLGRVKVDPGQIEQVVINLAINAKDAMPDGGELSIETANMDLDGSYAHKRFMVKSGSYVMLTVSDTGVGMTREVQEHVFEPFFTTKEKGKGTGLGLSTVYGIIKQSNGYIWVYSEPNQGSSFKIYLPRVAEEADAVEKDSGEIKIQRGSETILLVEDNDMLRDFAVKVLRKSGYTVLEAGNGKEALDTSARHQGPIQLLVTDVVMPGMNGRELARRLNSLRPEMKVMYISGYTDNAIVHHGMLEEGVFFLQKPFTPNLLLSKVREVLGE